MTEELMAYLQEHPAYFYITRDKQLIALIRYLSKGGKRFEAIAKELGIDEKKLRPILIDLMDKEVVTAISTAKGEDLFILNFAGQKILDLLEKAKKA
jgi:transcription initiation factor IIE alpha subunit